MSIFDSQSFPMVFPLHFIATVASVLTRTLSVPMRFSSETGQHRLCRHLQHCTVWLLRAESKLYVLWKCYSKDVTWLDIQYQQTLKMTGSTLRFSDCLDNSVLYSVILSAFYSWRLSALKKYLRTSISVTSAKQQTGLLYLIPLQKSSRAPLKKKMHTTSFDSVF